jgi:hypothetical protein
MSRISGRRTRQAIAVLLCAGLAAGSAGAVSLNSGGLATAITHVNDFEAITGPALLPASSHTQDQITVRYVGTSAAGGIITDYQPNGQRSWYNFGSGINYVEISTPFLISGLQLALGTGWSCCSVSNYQLLRGSTVLLEGSFANARQGGQGYDIFSFNGGLFDTVRLSSTSFGSFPIGNPIVDSTALDDVKVSRAVAAIPEPATWAMLVTGFGLAGQLARRRGGAQQRRPAAG